MENHHWTQRGGKTSGGRRRGCTGKDDRKQSTDVSRKPNRLQILSVVAGCTLIALPAFLCGCNSEKDIPDGEAEAYINTIAACKEVIARNPDDAEAYHKMANAYIGLKQYAEAAAAGKKAISIDPDILRAYLCLGHAYFNLGQRKHSHIAYSLCIERAKIAIATKPDDINAHVCIISAYWFLHKSVESIIACKKLIALDPDNPTKAFAHYTMGEGYRRLGQKTKAHEAYKKAIAIDPKGGVADSAREAM